MGLKAKAGEGEVGRVHLRPYFELAAIVGFADIAEKIDDLEKSAALNRAALQFAEPVAPNQRQPARQCDGVGTDCSEIAGRSVRHQAAIPCLQPRRQPSARSLSGSVIGVGGEPGEVEGHGLAFRRESDAEGAVLHIRRSDPRLRRNIAQRDQPLTIAGRPRFSVLRVVAEPDRVEAEGVRAEAEGEMGAVREYRHIVHRLRPVGLIAKTLTGNHQSWQMRSSCARRFRLLQLSGGF